MSIFSSIWGLFSKTRRLKNELANIDRKLDQINRQIDKSKGRDTSLLLARRTALIADRLRVTDLLEAL
jgi:hypothetical protein